MDLEVRSVWTDFRYKWDIPVTVVTSVRPDFYVGKQDIIWFSRSAPESKAFI